MAQHIAEAMHTASQFMRSVAGLGTMATAVLRFTGVIGTMWCLVVLGAYAFILKYRRDILTAAEAFVAEELLDIDTFDDYVNTPTVTTTFAANAPPTTASAPVSMVATATQPQNNALAEILPKRERARPKLRKDG